MRIQVSGIQSITLSQELSPKPCRTLKDTTPLQRGIIRHLILIVDLSAAMTEKDLRPTRYLLTIRYCEEFVTEFFEQNPISQLGILGMRDGLAVRVSDMSGNPTDHISNLQALRKDDPKGQPSLQNALDMARAALLYVPPVWLALGLGGLRCCWWADHGKAMHLLTARARSCSFSALSFLLTRVISILPSPRWSPRISTPPSSASAPK